SQRCLSLVNAKSVFGVEESLVATVLKQQQALSLEETVKENFHPDDMSNAIEAMQCLYETGKSYVEGRIRRIDGSFGWVAMSCTTLVSDTSRRILGFVSDINDLKIANETLKIEIQNDPMTGIYNKTTTVELAKELLNTSKDGLHALLVIDVDNFKGINDTLGHLFGDAVLIDISNKLKKLFRDDDIVGRIGGDEFVVFMKNVGNINVVSRKAKEICDAFKKTYTGENKEYKVSCSIGICTTETSFEYDRMFFCADKSLYQAKNSGKDGFWIYSGEEIQAPIKTRHIDRGVRSTLSMRDRVFELMYNSVDFESTVKMVLNYMCESFDASRAYVIENIDQNSGKNSFEWCADGIEPKIGLRQCVNCNVDKFDEDGQYFVKNLTIQQSFIETQATENDAIATFQVAIYNDGKATGIIGFDDCIKIRNDSEARRTEFADMAKMLGLFILKRRAEEKADFLGNICAQSHFKETNL
ncbi:MAG: sensor domain-containing diguanylate cyclase, partial [Oscillospiraceae bacterium]